MTADIFDQTLRCGVTDQAVLGVPDATGIRDELRRLVLADLLGPLGGNMRSSSARNRWTGTRSASWRRAGFMTRPSVGSQVAALAASVRRETGVSARSSCPTRGGCGS